MTINEAQSYLHNYINKPYFASLNNEWQKVVEEMAIHLDGVYPEKLIMTRRPYEDEERYYYRKANYEAITNGSIHEAIDGLYRIFNENNYTIQVSRDLERYIYNNYFGGKDFVSYIQDNIIINMIRDPNALLVCIPSFREIEEVVDIENYKVRPILEYIPSQNIIEMNDDLIMFCSNKNSQVYYHGKYRDKGKIIYIIDKQSIYLAKQVGQYSNNQFELKLLYNHNFDEIPAVLLGGFWNQRKGIYESYFKAFLPFANECIRQYSDWQGIMVTSAYPIREIRAVNCKNPDCYEGYVLYDNGNRAICPKCNGSGKELAIGPYGVFISDTYNPHADAEPGYADKPPIRFFSPPTDILEYSEKAWQGLLKKAREALHLEFIDEAQSGTAKAIDREREYAMILKISNNVFDNIIWKSLDFMERYRNPGTYTRPNVVKPTEFSIKSERDLIMDLSMLRERGAPDNLLKEINKEILLKRYSGNDLILQQNLFLMEKDVIYFKTQEEKLSLQGAGLVTRDQIIYSMYAPMVLDKLVRTSNDPISLFDNYEKLDALVEEELAPIYGSVGALMPESNKYL